MAQISTTANATGQATAAVVIINWWLTGHATPIPTDVAVAMGGYLALMGHTMEVVGEAVVNKIIAKWFPAAAPVLTAVETPNPGA